MQELKIKISEEEKQGLENGKLKLAIVEADKLEDVKGGIRQKRAKDELTRVAVLEPFELVK